MFAYDLFETYGSFQCFNDAYNHIFMKENIQKQLYFKQIILLKKKKLNKNTEL